MSSRRCESSNVSSHSSRRRGNVSGCGKGSMSISSRRSSRKGNVSSRRRESSGNVSSSSGICCGITINNVDVTTASFTHKSTMRAT
jgi:hypothetical protein